MARRPRFPALPVAALLSAAFLVACSAESPNPPSGETAATSENATRQPVVVTTSRPVDYLVAYLGGERFDRRLVLPPAGDPAHGSPTPETILDVQRADLVLAHLVDYETWMKTASLPIRKVVWTAEDLDLLRTGGRTHSHGGEGEHSHGEADPLTFTDPLLFLHQARNVRDALAELDPEATETLDERLLRLAAELESLDRDLGAVLRAGGEEPRELRVSDPEALGYWQRRFEISVVEADDGILFDPLTEPSEDGSYDYLARARAQVEKVRGALDAPSVPADAR